MNEDIADAVSKALRRAWQLGQTYWQQADSDSYKQNARSAQTEVMFMDLVEETSRMVAEIDEKLLAEICSALPAMREYARNNPKHHFSLGGVEQDPNGVHAWIARNKNASSGGKPDISEPPVT